LFPADLRNVVAGGARGGLSCCVIGARDNFEKHSWGSIGVVLGFKNKDSLVAADPHDCGSIEEMPTIRDLGDDEERQQAGTGAKRPRRR